MFIQPPPHVPASRIYAVDIFGLDPVAGEHQMSIKAIQRRAPGALFWTPHNGGHWVAAHSVLVERVLSDAALFSSRYVTVPKWMNPDPPVGPLQLDPPMHQAYRALIAPAMSGRASLALAEHARTAARQAIRRLRPTGRCEFMQDFARQLPIACFLAMCGLPATDHARLADIARLQLEPRNRDGQSTGFRLMGDYLMEQISSSRKLPGDNLIGQLTRAHVDGQPLPDHALFGLVNMLFIAGLDTVSSAIGTAARFLAQHPTLRSQLRAEPTLIPRTVEELLRRFPMFTAARMVRTDCELDGVLLKSGDMIVAPTALCGLDEERFDAPERVDPARRGARHASFGVGVHQCPGATLARAELRIFIETWLEEIPDFGIDPGAPVHLGPGPVASVLSLPLVWRPVEQPARDRFFT